MEKLTYNDLILPNYNNSSVALKLPAKVDGKDKILEFTLMDIVFAAELAKLNMLFVSDTGLGKSQLITDIAWHHFGGYNENEGNSNWADGRPNFEIEDLFVRSKVDLSSGKYDSETARQLKEDRVRRRLLCVDELNRAPKPKQNEFFDLADGKYTFNGNRYRLGTDNYALFLATANLNKMNGDFSGTFELDRALLNRAHITLDLDHESFEIPPSDMIGILESGTDAQVIVPKANDISNKIVAMHNDIIKETKQKSPYLTAFNLLLFYGLKYCDKDKYKNKSAAFPMLCSECDAGCNKDLCSSVKNSSVRTLKTIAPLAYAFSHLATLKYGKDVMIDPMDAALQAFRFTTYHGNLNDNLVREQYAGRKQALMDDTITKLESVVAIVKEYIPAMIDGNEPRVLVYNFNGNDVRTAKSDKVITALKKRGVSYTEKSIEEELKAQGIGSDWINAYKKEVSKK